MVHPVNQVRKTKAMLAALALSGWAMTAQGAESSPLPEGVAPERVITNDPRTTVRGCIGQLDTPYCAVQTLIAGQMWNDPALCDMSGGYGDCDLLRQGDIRHPSAKIFVPLGWIQLDEALLAKIRASKDLYATRWQPGDVILTLHQGEQDPDSNCTKAQVDGRLSPENFCLPKHPSGFSHRPYSSYVLRRNGSKWEVMDYDPEDLPPAMSSTFNKLLKMGVASQPSPSYPLPFEYESSFEWEKIFRGDAEQARKMGVPWHSTPPYPLTAREQPTPSRLPWIPNPPPPFPDGPPRLTRDGVFPMNSNGAAFEATTRDAPAWEGIVSAQTPLKGCLGDASTPFCTVLTYLAGEFTRNAEWVRLSGVDPEYAGIRPQEPLSNERAWFRLLPAGQHFMDSSEFERSFNHWRNGDMTLAVYHKRCETPYISPQGDSNQVVASPLWPTDSQIALTDCHWSEVPREFQLRQENAGQWRIVEFEDFRGSYHRDFKSIIDILTPYSLQPHEMR
ncbi:MAG: hypothetical protein HQL51_08870 [Magnetococcales bacterium]|nr:hypothetical protein [Magnetococcales bacterium]